MKHKGFSLQEKIDLVLYKDIDDLLKAEIYFKGRLSPYCTIDCKELLEELLKAKLTIVEKQDEAGVLFQEVGSFNFDKSNVAFDLSIGKVLGEVFEKEIFYFYDNYNPLSIKQFLSLCESNNTTINKDSYDKFLLAFSIQEKEYYCIKRYILSEEAEQAHGQIGKYYNEAQNPEQYFIELISTNQNECELAYVYEDCQYTDFLFIVLSFVLKNGYILKRCSYCKNWFVANKNDEKYCKQNRFIINTIDGQTVIDKIINCKDEAQKAKRKQRENGNKLLKIENSVRTKLAKRVQAKTISDDEIKKRQDKYFSFLSEKEKEKKKLKNNEITEETYIEWLKNF